MQLLSKPQQDFFSRYRQYYSKIYMKKVKELEQPEQFRKRIKWEELNYSLSRFYCIATIIKTVQYFQVRDMIIGDREH